jgi:hypothetical protein
VTRLFLLMLLALGCTGPRLDVDGARVEVTGVHAPLDEVEVQCIAAAPAAAPKCRAWLDGEELGCGSWARGPELGLYTAVSNPVRRENMLIFEAGRRLESCELLVASDVVAVWPTWP